MLNVLANISIPSAVYGDMLKIKRKCSVLIIGFTEFSEKMYPHCYDVIDSVYDNFHVTHCSADDKGVLFLRLHDILKPTASPGKFLLKLKLLWYSIRKIGNIGREVETVVKGTNDVIIALDHSALYYAQKYNVNKIPVIFWSLDIVTNDHPWNVSWFVRRMIEANRTKISQVNLIIVQDENRGQLLDDTIGSDKTPKYYLPVSLLEDDFSRDIARKKRSGFLSGSVKLMMVGSVCEGRGSNVIVDLYDELNDKTIELICHGHVFDSIKDKIDSLKSKISVINIADTFDHYRRNLSEAHIGIIVNKSIIANDLWYSMACGQLVEFTRMGIPVIVAFNDDVGNFVEREGCGVYLRDLSVFESVINNIIDNYAAYSAKSYGAFNCFFNLKSYIGSLVAVVEKVASSHRAG